VFRTRQVAILRETSIRSLGPQERLFRRFRRGAPLSLYSDLSGTRRPPNRVRFRSLFDGRALHRRGSASPTAKD